MNNEIKVISASLIDDPANAMRTGMDRDMLDELAESIKINGLINPITVRPKGERYEVVAGHRRFSACAIAHVFDIACVVRNLNDEQTFSVMAHENLFREDVDPVDEAIFIGNLSQNLSWSIEQIAEKCNRSKQWVNDRLAILNFPEYLVSALKLGKVSLGVAKYLGAITDDVYCRMFTDQAVNGGMSVLQASLLLNQFQLGILTPQTDPAMLDNGVVASESRAARSQCAKCGQIAIDPNLTMVFIHKECPVSIPESV